MIKIDVVNEITPEQFAAALVLSSQLHWLRVAEDNVIELYLDHHMMAMFRMCPARFELEMVQGYKVKVPEGVGTGFWPLEFGILIHRILEYYYQNFRNPNFKFDDVQSYGVGLWYEMNMEYFKGDKGYTFLGGEMGLRALLLMYFMRFSPDNERLRIVGTEMYFGKGKEVPLQAEPTRFFPFRLYLAGKMDLIIDDSMYIAPLDHKSSGDFRGKDPQQRFIIQEGMTGYVYANRFITRDLFRILDIDPTSRRLDMILMNHMQVKSCPMQDRFKRIPMFKTDQHLEDWRGRQLATARDILNATLGTILTPKQSNFWMDAGHCTDWYHGECLYFPLHRNDSLVQIGLLQKEYVKKPIWNPETRDPRMSVLNSLEHI